MKNILRHEKYFFLAVVILHLLPLLMLEFFVTHDGPSHVYNSAIISRLFHGDALTSKYFMFNPQPVPNWLGHFLLCLFNIFFSANISEKILIGLYIVSLAYSFRMLLLSVNHESAWGSWLIFPFIYSLYLYQGLHNFCLAIPVLFFSLNYYIRNAGSLSPKHFLTIAFFGTMLYFSHIFSLILFGLMAGAYLITEFFIHKIQTTEEKNFMRLCKRLGFLALALLPGLIMAVQFVTRNAGLNEGAPEPTFPERLVFLFIARPLITLNYDEEIYYSGIVAVAFWSIWIIAVVSRMRKFSFRLADFWFIASILILIIYLTVPDTLASGNFVSLRLLVFYYLFSIIWIGTNILPGGLKNFSMAVFSMLSLLFLIYHYTESETTDKEAKEYFSVSGHVREGSIVLPVCYSVNWLHSNLSNYLGAEKNVVLLDNYEAAMSHFPTMWKPELDPYAGMNIGYASSPCLDIERYQKISGQNIDYIIRWGYNKTFQDSCAQAISAYILKNYFLIFTSANNKAEVFQRKK